MKNKTGTRRDGKRGKDSVSAKRREARKDKAIARGDWAGRKADRARQF